MTDATGDIPLAGADGRRVCGFTLVLGRPRPLRRSGWCEFSLGLRSGERPAAGERPLVRGIYSRGGRDGIRPWMDVEYLGGIPGAGTEADASLSRLGRAVAQEIFALLGEAIPPGGHLMVSYEGDDGIHVETLAALSWSVPPAATPLGRLLVLAGFTHVKDWYLAEGGMEGPRKLWGEKAPDPAWERIFGEWTEERLAFFLDRGLPPGAPPCLAAARKCAVEILGRLRTGRRGSGT